MAKNTVRRLIAQMHNKPLSAVIREKAVEEQMSPEQIADFLDLSPRTVLNVVREEGWTVKRQIIIPEESAAEVAA